LLDYTAFKDLSPGKFMVMIFFYVVYSVVSTCADACACQSIWRG
jgi:hypothetical protein